MQDGRKSQIASKARKHFRVVILLGPHLFPFRTQPLSPTSRWYWIGRVGYRSKYMKAWCESARPFSLYGYWVLIYIELLWYWRNISSWAEFQIRSALCTSVRPRSALDGYSRRLSLDRLKTDPRFAPSASLLEIGQSFEEYLTGWIWRWVSAPFQWRLCEWRKLNGFR